MEIIIFLVLFVIAFPFAMILIVKVGENLGLIKGSSQEEIDKRRETAAKNKEKKDF